MTRIVGGVRDSGNEAIGINQRRELSGVRKRKRSIHPKIEVA